MSPPHRPTPRRGARRAIVIGGSMSGLLAAALLRRIGWDVDVFERSSVELVGRGAGITTHPELLDVLELCGAGTRDLGVEVERRIAIDERGCVIAERPLRQIVTSWDRLQHLLRAREPDGRYHLGHAFAGAEQDGGGVTVRFVGGRTERADLVVAADGFRSSVRAQVAPDAQPVYAGYLVWRGAPDEASLSAATRVAIFPYFTFFLPPRQQVIGYPIAGLNNEMRPGHRRYNFIWYRVVGENQLRDMCTDAEGRHHEFSIAPPLIRPDVIAEMRATAEQTMAPPFLDTLRRIERPFFTPIYDLVSPRMVFGRIVLIGDAASVARPHMGYGVSKAAEDARVLAEALGAHGDDLDAALAQFETVRQPIDERVVAHGRKLGTHLGVDLKTDDDRAMWKELQDPEAMMRSIAVPHFLGA
jgi:2-polyprenyl-6-methoxyphenol hydroxylase-like FAD-dependent oxidoreductase